jgi:hypothetical protein
VKVVHVVFNTDYFAIATCEGRDGKWHGKPVKQSNRQVE